MTGPVVVFGSAVAHSGVTTAVAAIGSMMGGAPVLVEADPSGGDLVARLAALRGEPQLTEEPSLQTLAAAGRAGLTAGVILNHLQVLPGPAQVRALVAPLSGSAATQALSVLVPAGLVAALAGLDGPVLVDVGRIDARSVTEALVREVGEGDLGGVAVV